MNSDQLILRETTNPPLTTKGDYINSSEFDQNLINIYNDLVALCNTSGVIAFDIDTTYDDAINQFATFNGRLYRWINSVEGSGVTPSDEGASEFWLEIFPTDLAHRKNSDTILAEGTENEVSAAEIKAFIAAGLTSTTDLSISARTSTAFTLNSSTGADVTIPQATATEAGLLNAEDKGKLQRLSGNNTGDQTLEGLGAEAVSNKAIDFATLNNELYPTVQATETRIGERIDELKGAPPVDLDTLEKMAGAIANPTRMTTIGKNTTGATLYKGTVVYINGASGGVPTFAKAKADSETTSARTLGVLISDVSHNNEGYAVTIGDLSSLDTRTSATNPFTSDTLAIGDQLYLSPTTAGYVTNVKPTAPNHLVYIGKVLNVGSTDGEILFQIQNGYELEELHNVKTGATDGQYLKWVASSGLWEPSTISTDLTVGTTAIANGTIGRIMFQGIGNVVQQSSSLFWDNTNSRLSIGQGSSPGARLDIASPGALSTDLAFRVRNSANTQNSFQIDGLGQGRIKSTSYIPKFSIGYDWFGSDRNAFVFTQNIQNSRGQEWTFDAGYNGAMEGLRIFNDLTGSNKGLFTIQANNYCFGTEILNAEGAVAERVVLRIANGVAPTTSKVDEFKFYSADIVAGNASPHFRTEAGNIIKLFTGAALTTPDGTLSNAVARIAELEARLQANGLIL